MGKQGRSDSRAWRRLWSGGGAVLLAAMALLALAALSARSQTPQYQYVEVDRAVSNLCLTQMEYRPGQAPEKRMRFEWDYTPLGGTPAPALPLTGAAGAHSDRCSRAATVGG